MATASSAPLQPDAPQRGGPGSADRSHPRLMLAGWLLLCLAPAALGALFPPDAWFRALDKPAFQPPNWVFGPVWTTLYVLMAIAAWRIWRQPSSSRRTFALAVFLVQLALNAAWTPTFFGAHQIGLALLVQIALDAAVLTCWWQFRQLDRVAGWLLVPYLTWLSLATALGIALLRLNGA